MEPKFQSSFIPKGPTASTAAISMGKKSSEKSFLAFIARVVFTGSVLLALGAFGYKFYLNYSLTNLAAELETGRTALEPDTVEELLDLNGRLVSTKELIANHSILSPLFRFLEASTLRSVQFTAFNYEATPEGIKIIMKGEARSYGSLALEADLFTKSKYFKNSVFSDLSLDDSGNVLFSFEAMLDPTLLSYPRFVETVSVPPPSPATLTPLAATSTSAGVSTSTATTTPR